MPRGLINLLLGIIFILLIIVIIVSFLADAQFNAAAKLIGEYRWTKAESKFEQAIAMNPFNSQYPSELGNLLLRQCEYLSRPMPLLKKAENLYMIALKLNPTCADYWVKLGGIESWIGKETNKYDTGMVMKCFRSAFRNDPKSSNTSYSIGYLGISILDLLGGEDRKFIFERLRYAINANPQCSGIIYYKVWNKTKDFGLLKDITPESREANERLYNFIAENNLWEFRKEQAGRVAYYKQKESPEEFTEAEIKKRREMEKIRMSPIREWEGATFDGKNVYDKGNMYWSGTITRVIDMPGGESVVKIEAKGSPADGIYPYMIVELEGKEIGELYVDSPGWKEYGFSAKTGSGLGVLSVTFVNDIYNAKGEDRNLFIRGTKIERSL